MGSVTVVGSYLSPYVRKVLVCLDLKGVVYEIDPIVPFYGNDAFTEISPVRRIPVLIGTDGMALADSTVICEYLEDAFPGASLFPRTPRERARARWLEEFADSRMGEVFIWRIFNQLVINRFVWGLGKDAAILERALKQEVPQILDYLEQNLPANGFIFDEISIADIACASFFRNLELARCALDLRGWPRTESFVSRVLGHHAFRKLNVYEDLSMKTPIDQHREALREAGAPVSERTFFTPTPRRGILST